MKDIYMVTTEDGSEFAFNDFKLVDQFIAPLKNGSFYFRKVAVIENQQDLNLATTAQQINQSEQKERI